MKWFFVRFLWASIGIIHCVHAFEVKVLLHKSGLADCSQNTVMLKSDSGFVLSRHPTLSLGLGYLEKQILIHDAAIADCMAKGKVCYITPGLSTKQQHMIQQKIASWFSEHKAMILEQLKLLHVFFDQFVAQKGMLQKQEYAHFKKYLGTLFEQYTDSLLVSIAHDQDPLLSADTLKQYGAVFLKKDMARVFLDGLAKKQLSKGDKRLLQTDLKFRYTYFDAYVRDVAQTLLHEFVCALPRDFLSQWLHEAMPTLQYENNAYLGTFKILQEADQVYLINNVAMDDYLLSVIFHEGWPGWSLAMNKVMAIVCRTYLVWQILQAQKQQRPYHIESGIRHQVYKGHHQQTHLKKAIAETKDICIAYENKPILAMFDACCGGVIPAYMDRPGYQKHPYLLRKKPCTFCSEFKVARWSSTFLCDDLAKILHDKIGAVDVIQNIQVCKKDKAGLATDVVIKTSQGEHHVHGKKMYFWFPEIKSFCFDIAMSCKKVAEKYGIKKQHKKNKQATKSGGCEHKNCSVTISGKGYGHHMGLCQWGAMKLVRDHHWDYRKVLQFYYPGTTLIKLTH